MVELRKTKDIGASRTVIAVNNLKDADFPPINLTTPRELIRIAGGTHFLEELVKWADLQRQGDMIVAAYNAKKAKGVWLTQKDFARDMGISRPRAAKILAANKRPDYLKGMKLPDLRRLWKLLDLHHFDEDQDVMTSELRAVITGMRKRRNQAGEKIKNGVLSPQEMSLVCAVTRKTRVVNPEVLEDDKEFARWLADRSERWRANHNNVDEDRFALVLTGAADWLAAREHLCSFIMHLKKLAQATQEMLPSGNSLRAEAVMLAGGLMAICHYRDESGGKRGRAGGRRKKSAVDTYSEEVARKYGFDQHSLRDASVPLGCVIMQSKQLRQCVSNLLCWDFGRPTLPDNNRAPGKEPD